MTNLTAFLALPITKSLGSDGLFLPNRQAFYASLIQALSERDIATVSPVLNEDWGRIKLRTGEFTKFDLDAIRRADLLFVAADDINRDISLEINFATGLGRPIIVLLPVGARVDRAKSAIAEGIDLCE